MKKAQGFTLVELVVVILILGILSATALPKFLDLGTGARQSALNAAFAATKSALEMKHLELIASGNAASADDPDINGIAVENGYLSTATNTITDLESIVDLSEDFDPTYDAATDMITVTHTSATDGTQCNFTYSNPVTPGTDPADLADTLTLNDGNCG